MTECPSRFGIVRWRTNDLGPDEAERIGGHVRQCAVCHDVLANLDLNIASYQAEEERHLALLKQRIAAIGPKAREVPSARRTLWLIPAFGTLAVIAVAAILWIRPDTFGMRSGVEATRYKGALSCEVVAKRGEEQFRVSAGAKLRPDDALRFILTTDEKGYVLIFSVDATQRVTSFYPDQKGATRLMPLPLAAPGRHVLPGSVVLDDSTGDEAFFVVFSDRTFDVSPILDAAGKAVRDHGLEGLKNLRLEPGMRIERLDVTKEGRAR